MKNTKIDWADITWNPVTGCQHGCDYCYANKIAQRFGGHDCTPDGERIAMELAIGPQRMEEPKYRLRRGKADKAPYPWFFLPTFHAYRLNEPSRIKKPQTIFVCSMADLFGNWVPDSWVKEVFDSCERAPWHRYLFLTKNPMGMIRKNVPRLKNAWYGTSVTKQGELSRIAELNLLPNRFVSIEPMLEPIDVDEQPMKSAIPFADWVIVGSETGNRKDRIEPKREWIDKIANACNRNEVPLFMKESLRGLMGSDFVQEFPWKI